MCGAKNFEINTSEILKYIINQNIIKLKDKTKLKIDLKDIACQENLKGIFIKELLEKLDNDDENREIIEKAIEIGLNAF